MAGSAEGRRSTKASPCCLKLKIKAWGTGMGYVHLFVNLEFSDSPLICTASRQAAKLKK